MKGRLVLRYVGNRPEPEPEPQPEFDPMPPLPIGIFLFMDELRKLTEWIPDEYLKDFRVLVRK